MKASGYTSKLYEKFSLDTKTYMCAKQKQRNKYSLHCLEHRWQSVAHRDLSREEIQLKVEKKVGNP